MLGISFQVETLCWKNIQLGNHGNEKLSALSNLRDYVQIMEKMDPGTYSRRRKEKKML